MVQSVRWRLGAEAQRPIRGSRRQDREHRSHAGILIYPSQAACKRGILNASR